MSDKIVVFDTTLRDGEQTAGVCFSARDKVKIATTLADMRVDVIEAGFPAASAAEREAVSAVAREVQHARICALARAVPFDIDAAAESLRDAARPRIHTFINTSDVQLAHQLRKDRDDVLSMVEFAVGFNLEKQTMDWFEMHYGNGRDITAEPQYAIVRAEDCGDLPPALLLTAGYDPLQDDGQLYGRNMAAAGVSVDFKHFASTVHGFLTMGRAIPVAVEALNYSAAKLREAFASC